MTIAFPRADVLSGVEFVDSKFRLIQRQELSRQANGITRGKDFGSALWAAQYFTQPLDNYDGQANNFEAILNSLDGVINPFEGYDLRRIYPAAYPNGDFSSLGAGWFANKTWDFNGSVEGFTGTSATLSTATANVLTVTASGANNGIISPTGLGIDGSKHRKVRARIRRLSGSGVWQGQMYYGNAAHPYGISPWLKTIPAPAVPGTFSEVTWDMGYGADQVSVDWRNNGPIDRIRLDFWGNGDVIEIDWIAIGDTMFRGDCLISSVNANNKALALKGLPSGYVASRGDYLAFNYGTGPSRALHQIVEGVIANSGGVTSQFEVRPHIRPGAAADIAVSLVKASGQFILMPEPLEQSMQSGTHTTMSFQAIQYL